MLPLPELQRRFARALADGHAPLPPIRANRLAAPQRLQVYRNNTRITLVEALRSVYPAVQRLVGEGFFEAAAEEYVRLNPSSSGNVQDYGGAFPVFLRAYAPAASLPYLGEVAMLEWRRLQTALAPSHTPMDLAALAAVPEDMLPELRFHHQPAARALESPFPILSIWEFCQDADPEGEFDLDIGGECVLFSRPALDVTMRRLSRGEHVFLKTLCRGDTFAAACEAALVTEPSFDVRERFAVLVREEILTSFYS